MPHFGLGPIGWGGIAGRADDKGNVTLAPSFQRFFAKLWELLEVIPHADHVVAMTNQGATPDVSEGNIFEVTNSGATTITNFINGRAGQWIRLVFMDGNTTLTDGGNLRLAGGFTSTADDTMTLFTTDGTIWYEQSRSIN